MNSSTLETSWAEIKKDIQKIWNQITADELEQSRGELMSISGLIEEKYGHEKEEITQKLTSIFKKFGQTTDTIKQNIDSKKL